MMPLSELAREQSVFDWVTSVAVRGTNRSCSRLFLLVYVVGTLATIFMSNDATAVVLTPAWPANFRPPSVLSILVIFAVMRFLFREALCKGIDCEDARRGLINPQARVMARMRPAIKAGLRPLARPQNYL
jgi:arsenical pump membrane protein